jgi:hypothetical protein
MSSAVYEAVNAINAQLPMAKAMVFAEGRQIFLSTHVLVDILSAAELMFAIDLVSGAADHFDSLLQKRFGGATMLHHPDDSIDD